MLKFAVHLSHWLAFMLLLSIGLPGQAQAQPQKLAGQWFESPPGWRYAGQQSLENSGLVAVAALNRTGGHYFFETDFEVPGDESLVVDFKNSSVIGRFHHWIFDSQHHLVAEAEGGIQSKALNPFFLRHGRVFSLSSGHYRLITEITSPFFLAQPRLYLDSLAHYQQAIKLGDALTLLSLGVLLGLMFYYAALAYLRKNKTDALYALFLLGNLLYNGTALLVFSELFDLHWFYLISIPILFSNAIYILFVINLLGIRRANEPRLYNMGMVLLGLFTALIGIGIFWPHWSLELDRSGVALFMSYGLIAGVVRARQGYPVAKMYLIAVCAFFVLGAASISLGSLPNIYTIYVEHLGLMAVTIEALLLALVLASQFSQLRMQFEMAHTNANQDSLTGLLNRRGFFDAGNAEVERARRYAHPISVIFLDLDNFKVLNDASGHSVGDIALQEIAKAMLQVLRFNDKLARLGGDEFAIMIPEIGYDAVVEAGRKISIATREALCNFSPVTASIGVIWFEEVDCLFPVMMQAADDLMYEVKRSGKNDIRFCRYERMV